MHWTYSIKETEKINLFEELNNVNNLLFHYKIIDLLNVAHWIDAMNQALGLAVLIRARDTEGLVWAGGGCMGLLAARPHRSDSGARSSPTPVSISSNKLLMQ
jgi:hypothetical protein